MPSARRHPSPTRLVLLLALALAARAQTPLPVSDDAPLLLDPLIVDTASDDDDRYDSTGMGMKEAETYEAPFSNEIIFDELPPDKLESTLDEDMAAVAGASRAEVAASGTRLRLRGFPTPQLRDSYSQTGVPQILSVRRSQTIQGPLVSVTGRGAPGGIQNFLTFRPRAKPQTSAGFEFNDQDDRSFDFETTGPLVKKKAWGRTALDWDDRHGPQEFAWEHILNISASATVRPTRRTSAMVQIDHERYSGNPAPGLPEFRASASSLIVGPYRPLALFHGYGPDAGVVKETTGATVQLETQLTPRLSFRIAVQGMTRTLDEDRFTRGVFQLDTGTFGGVREPLHTEQPLDLAGVQADLSSRFRFLGLDHKIFIGVEQIQSSATRTQRALTTADRDTLLPADVRTFDPLAPNYFRPAYSPAVYRRVVTDRDEDTTYRGVTFSDRTAFADGKLVVTAGARYSGVELDLHDRRPGAPFAEVTDKASDITWHSGANYVLIPGRVLAFANASTAFEPSTRVDARTGRIQGNETTSGFEAGVKGMVSRRLNYTAFVYDFTNENISRRNPRYNDPVLDPNLTEPELLAAGEERFRGAHAEVRYQLTPAFRINATAVYTHAETVRSPDLPQEEGRALIRTPPLELRGGVRYTWSAGRLKGLDAGLSANYTDGFVARYADSTRAYLDYPGVTQLYAQSGYRWNTGRYQHQISVSVRNVLDKDLLATLDQVGRERSVSFNYELRF